MIINFDNYLLQLIAVRLKNPVFDLLMPALSDLRLWIVPMLVLLFLIFKYDKLNGKYFVFALFAAVLLSDSVCGSVLKPLIARPRPVGGLGSYSFPSCHAANMFTVFTVAAFYYKKFIVRAGVLLIAIMVAYSRIYTLSHYPTDILGGILMGLLSGTAVSLAFKKIRKKESTR